jgi:hypothetical protein
MRHVGYHFGPAFQPCQQVEAKADSRQCRALVRLQAPESRYPQSQYAMHPAAIDGCLQIATVALNRGHHSAINTLMPPALIDNLVIFPHETPSSGEAIVASEALWSGVGRPDDNKRYVSDIRAISQESKELLFHLEGLRYHAINASAERPHAFTQVVWKPDIDFITSAQTAHILKEALLSGKANDNDHGDVAATLTQMAELLALIAHKRPSARILEVALRDGSTAGDSLYLDHVRARAGPIAGGCNYRLLAPSQHAGLVAHEKYAGEPGVAVQVVDAEQGPFEYIEGKYSFIILKVPEGEVALEQTIQRARDALAVNGYLIVVRVAGLPFMNGTYHFRGGQDKFLRRYLTSIRWHFQSSWSRHRSRFPHP